MALTLGTNCGFVLTAPTADPTGTAAFCDATAFALKVTAPTGALKINQVGWWADNANSESNFEVGLYSHNSGTNRPNALLNVSRTNAKGTTAGWKTVTVDWDITPGTVYWIAVQLDEIVGNQNTDYTTTAGAIDVWDFGATTLVDPFVTEANYGEVVAIYARYQRLVSGVNVGFVTTAPTDSLAAEGNDIGGYATVSKFTSPSTAAKITEMGWWACNATDEANFEVGLYADSSGVPGSLLFSDITNAKGTTAGWKTVTVDWAISPSTNYWLGVQVDTTSPLTLIDAWASLFNGWDFRALTALPDPFGGGAVSDADATDAIYAVWEAAAAGGNERAAAINQALIIS